MRALLVAWIALSISCSLTGCVATRKPVVACNFPKQAAPAAGTALVAQEYGQISPIPLDAVQFTGRVLSKEIAVQSLQAHRTPTNTVQVTARLINCTDEPRVVGVRSNFMDRQELATEPATAWQNVVLQPRAMGTYQENSMGRGVEHYVVELRDAGP
jgi:hypothetical protein